jgi:RimJ/RimL family protein N-acetyltransferase
LVIHDRFEQDLSGRFARFDDAGYFTILDPDQRPIGRIEFERLDERCRSTQVMILIGEPDAQGRGFGRDAMRALLTYLFLDRNLHRVELTVIADNVRAIRAYDAIGFGTEGRLRGNRFVDGERVDELIMSILRPEFDALRDRE